jgi:hypothetical protein
MVLEQTHGKDAVHKFLYLQQIEYLNRRGRGDLPLLTTGDNANVHYRKGAVAMYALKHFIGEERINSALNALVTKFRYTGVPLPTSLDLYRELQAVTPDSLEYVLTDLLETITIWDLRASSVQVDSLGNDEYRVTLGIEAAKFRVDSLFNHTEVPINDLIDIGVFGEGEGTASELYYGKHWIRPGMKSITVTVRGKPARAGIDPYTILLARRGDDILDNVKAVPSR